jgi:hypothetical protein
MPTFRIWQHGQSNMIWLNNTTPGSPVDEILIPTLQQLVDPLQTEATLARYYDQANTCFNGGIGMVLDSSQAIAADGYAGTAGSNTLVRAAPPSDSVKFPDWASWPLTTRGTNGIAFASAVAAATKAEISCILAFHSEYDTRGWATNGWTANDPRIVEYGWRRYMGALRAALGKTAANCPIMSPVPIPYTVGSNEGFNNVAEAFHRLAADPSFNMRIITWQTMDCTWDRDGPAGSYTWHASNADLALLARRLARGIAREMGPVWAPNGFRSRPCLGPRAWWAQAIDATTIDVWVKHDGGAALTLPATPGLGWNVTYNGRAVSVSGAAVQADNRRIRLTLAEACPSWRLLRVAYGWNNTRLDVGGGIYDDAATFDPKAIAAGVTGPNRINDALHRSRTRIAVQPGAPTFTP